MSENKTQGQILSEKLSYDQKSAWEKLSEEEFKITFDLCDRYKSFLNRAKTERDFTTETEKLARSKGYISIDEVIKSNKKLQPGMKVYTVGRNKTVALAVIGDSAMENGVNIIGAHIDAPRIDLKPNPMYEANDMVFLKTHYYGGIKKYQWVTIPLSIHGVIVKRDGSIVNVSIGEDDNDPVFTITDLLPHLAAEQMQKKMSEAITGEGLNILSGSIPYKDDKVKDKVKLNVLNLLNEKYGIIEEDFLSAELEMVPKFNAVDVGFDKSMVGSYGQDDRVCAYAALEAILDTENVKMTAVCILSDKEEVGSMGNTGAQSSFFVNFLADLCNLSMENYNDIILRKCLSNSKMLSADVNAAIDPNFEGVYDKRNSSFLGRGIVLQKYTGSRGKAGASDANAEFVGEVRKLFNDNNIVWQSAELGKVDQGGGGTIAQYIANLNVDVIDCGVAILSMHSPFEITSKVDIYMSYKAYKIFFIA
ncbi:aminopeptidase [Acetivibrio cellulolyticus]|uniref:aminopeptidase n=1 Tax=Acetivibrio cellulolyticus TaxID=35830 RepID=UPI0001E2BE2D|nr:aminopeptidase [Acetivibrio cellulolyticus]